METCKRSNMAKLVKLYNQLDHIKEEYFIRNRIAEENRQRENSAAIKIQSFVRGYQTRAHLQYLHRNAIIIQKIWRTFKAQQHFRKRVKTAYFEMKMNFYNKMAVKIQKRWRGYYIRKYVHNLYARKRYLETLVKKNEKTRRELQQLADHQKKERDRAAIEREEKEKYMRAQRLHFLLSTKQRPGVFNSPFRLEPDEMELRLRTVKLLQARSASEESVTSNQQPSSYFSKIQKIPPIHKKPQGPFRPAAEVHCQRQRPLEPSLRVATSITALEDAREELKNQEWKTRLIDEPFLPSTTVQQKKYEMSLQTQSPYHQMKYGTKHFREEAKDQLQGKKEFKTVFTTCNVFDKFGRLYSNAGNIV